MNLEELTGWLFARTTGGIRFGLETTRALLAGVGDPHRRFRVLHVGGTNGKGSVAALCEAALRERAGGERVGLYTSPHLVSFAERVRVDGRPVPDERLVEAAQRLRPLIEETGATFFEATTALAFLCFAEAGVELAVVEVGLGGRLDSTNVVQPIATAVTNVSREHTEYLGESLAEIATEKAGIFKSGVPAVTGAEDPDVVRVLRERAAAAGAPLHLLEEMVEIRTVATSLDGTRLELRSRAWGERSVQIPLVGAFQARNAALAAELLGLLPRGVRPTWDELERGFASTRWPGRFQVVRSGDTTWIFDVAHNPAGVAALAATLDRLELPRPLVLVGGILSDKEWKEMLGPLLRRVDAAVLTIPSSAPPARRWDPAEAARWAGQSGGPPVRVIPDLAAAVQRAGTLAPHGTVLVTGSIFTVGDAMTELQIPTT